MSEAVNSATMSLAVPPGKGPRAPANTNLTDPLYPLLRVVTRRFRASLTKSLTGLSSGLISRCVRELSIYTYRIIYEIIGPNIYILAVAHKRRELKEGDIVR